MGRAPTTEATRLRLLADYGVMDTAPDEVLDQLVALASTICDAPISLVSLVDATRQWFAARVGVDAEETPREQAFCAHAIADPTHDIFQISDARLDPRFESNPLVTGDPNIVFYAGAPLVAEGGSALGTLCVIDTKPRALTGVQRRALVQLSELVVKRLQDRRDHALEVAAQRRYEATLTSIGEAVLTTDIHGVVTFVNPAARELTGWPNDSAIGRGVGEVFELIGERLASDPIAGVVETGVRTTIDRTALVRRDRSEVPIEVTLAPITSARGEVTGVIMIARDQTEPRRRERELAARDERLRFTVEAASAGTWDLDPATGAIVANERMVELMGLERGATLTLETAISSLQADDRGAVTTAVHDALAGRNGGAYRMEFRTGGSATAPLRWVESRAQAYFDDNGAPLRLAGVMLDVTSRKAVEAEHERTAALIAQLLDTMSDGFLAIDKDWVLTTANQAFERISTLKRADVIGRPFWDVFPVVRDERGMTWTNYNRCMTERVPVAFQSYYAVLDRWTDQRANPTEDGGIAVFFHDITAAKRAERVLEQQAAFERQLIGIVSHDLRTPLSVVTMASELLAIAPELSAASHKLVARNHHAADRATAMIRDLLDFTQARIGGGLRIEREDHDVEQLTRSVIDELDAAHPGRTIAFRSTPPSRAKVDGGRFAQIVQNLVSNALKYSPPGSPVAVVLDGGALNLVLTVHNEGIPIPGEQLPVLFEPFERGVLQSDSASRSVGLGLYIVKQIVEGHGGTIAVSSTASAGTTFRVSLPRT